MKLNVDQVRATLKRESVETRGRLESTFVIITRQKQCYDYIFSPTLFIAEINYIGYAYHLGLYKYSDDTFKFELVEPNEFLKDDPVPASIKKLILFNLDLIKVE